MVESDECTAAWQDSLPEIWDGSALLASSQNAREDLAPRESAATHPNKFERRRSAAPGLQPDSLDWKTRFLRLLPLIRSTARRAFHNLNAEQRDEAVQK